MANNNFKHMNKVLEYFNEKYQGNWNKIHKAIKTSERLPLYPLDLKIRKNNLNVINILDEDYPNKYKNMYAPPFLIYSQGNSDLLYIDSSKVIALHGNFDIDEFDNLPVNNKVLAFTYNDKNVSFYNELMEKGFSLLISDQEQKISISENGKKEYSLYENINKLDLNGNSVFYSSVNFNSLSHFYKERDTDILTDLFPEIFAIRKSIVIADTHIINATYNDNQSLSFQSILDKNSSVQNQFKEIDFSLSFKKEIIFEDQSAAPYNEFNNVSNSLIALSQEFKKTKFNYYKINCNEILKNNLTIVEENLDGFILKTSQKNSQKQKS